MKFSSSNIEKASILSKLRLGNEDIARLEEINIKDARYVRQLLEAEIITYAKSNRPEDRQWRIYKSQIKRGYIPTEAYIKLRMTEFGYQRIHDLAKQEQSLI